MACVYVPDADVPDASATAPKLPYPVHAPLEIVPWRISYVGEVRAEPSEAVNVTVVDDAVPMPAGLAVADTDGPLVSSVTETGVVLNVLPAASVTVSRTW